MGVRPLEVIRAVYLMLEPPGVIGNNALKSNSETVKDGKNLLKPPSLASHLYSSYSYAAQPKKISPWPLSISRVMHNWQKTDIFDCQKELEKPVRVERQVSNPTCFSKNKSEAWEKKTSTPLQTNMSLQNHGWKMYTLLK